MNTTTFYKLMFCSERGTVFVYFDAI